MKYIIVTGGVLSGLGKGITASSIGRLLISRGYSMTAIKIDPYLNVDAGTMNPYEHGEVYVLDDGGEVDLDLGNYERFMEVNMGRDNNITTGKVYFNVIQHERHGDYLGSTVQIIPHITDEIKRQIRAVTGNSKADMCIIELGGTVGDIESAPFLEAIRQLMVEVGHDNAIVVHTTLVPIMSVVGEQKTKPTQHSVKELRAIGIIPDFIVGRGSEFLTEKSKKKIALFCNVPAENVLSAPNVRTIYEVPLVLEEQHAADFILKRFNLPAKKANLTKWTSMVDRIVNPKQTTNITFVGKYVHLKDSYMSHIEAFNHAGSMCSAKVNINWVEAEDLENPKEDPKKGLNLLKGTQGILVPGGFGARGSEGKIIAANYAMDKKIPYLGVCFGFQLAVIAYCRKVMKLEDANSSELNPNTPHPVIDLLPEQGGVVDMGGTMRLGSHEINLEKDCLTARLYKKTIIAERHRHRYEVNPKYIDNIHKSGLKFVGRSKDGTRMEVLELKGHPFFLGCQFHPEFKSRPGKPSPLHYGLLKAALKNVCK